MLRVWGSGLPQQFEEELVGRSLFGCLAPAPALILTGGLSGLTGSIYPGRVWGLGIGGLGLAGNKGIVEAEIIQRLNSRVPYEPLASTSSIK